MRATITLIIAVLLTFGHTNARADVLVLVHGYLASADSWEISGINNLLDANGWKRGGLISSSPAMAAPV